jgi:hypothetical protein
MLYLRQGWDCFDAAAINTNHVPFHSGSRQVSGAISRVRSPA